MFSSDKIAQAINKQEKPIVLVGMMGCGKTHIGRMLAHDLDLPFIDSDKEIEKDQGKPIVDIFDLDGEESFRKLERQKIKDIMGQGPCVLSVGGGAFVNEHSRKTILEVSISIWLDSDIETLFERVSRNDKRPLLKTENPKQMLAELLEARKPFYEQAYIHVRSDQKDTEIVENIKNSLCAYLNLD
ncbi:MAG: shikimate kinase [Alphaproteobacteria bacterium]|nr:shikimate kinase [Alphaproteobacteria bacterium]